LIASIIQAMKEKPVFIADGHHRYETCLRYREEREALLGRRDASDPFQWTLMYFTPMEDEGLVIYPTHKMVRGVRGFRRSSFLRRLRRDFLVQEFPFEEGVEDKTRRLFLQTLRREGQSQSAIGLLIHGDRVYRVVTPRDPQRLIKRLSRVPECVRDLDVTLLHEIVFRQFLKIDVADLKDQHLSYVHDPDQSLEQAVEGQVQIAFIMNPTRVEDLKSVASARCKMPQKATYFYPKLLSGLVINVMKDGESIISP
jgi:uncharacterized protein (DUF1015 family)